VPTPWLARLSDLLRRALLTGPFAGKFLSKRKLALVKKLYRDPWRNVFGDDLQVQFVVDPQVVRNPRSPIDSATTGRKTPCATGRQPWYGETHFVYRRNPRRTAIFLLRVQDNGLGHGRGSE